MPATDGSTGMVAAVVVGEVLLRGGEAGSVVPTKVPGNLRRRARGTPQQLGAVSIPRGPQSMSRAHCSGKETPVTYMAPWELAA